MLRKIRKKTAQSTLEYAVLAVIIIAALIAMRIYLQQGIQGKLKSSTDDISAEKFDPTETIYNKTTVSYSKTQDTVNAGVTNSHLLDDETTNVDISSTTAL